MRTRRIIVEPAIKNFFARLVHNADDRLIYRRVMLLDCLLNPADGKQILLAKKLGISRQAVNLAIERINAQFEVFPERCQRWEQHVETVARNRRASLGARLFLSGLLISSAIQKMKKKNAETNL